MSWLGRRSRKHEHFRVVAGRKKKRTIGRNKIAAEGLAENRTAEGQGLAENMTAVGQGLQRRNKISGAGQRQSSSLVEGQPERCKTVVVGVRCMIVVGKQERCKIVGEQRCCMMVVVEEQGQRCMIVAVGEQRCMIAVVEEHCKTAEVLLGQNRIAVEGQTLGHCKIVGEVADGSWIVGS